MKGLFREGFARARPLSNGTHAAPLQVYLLERYQRLAVLMTFVLLGAIIFAALPSFAQEATQPITFDQVNVIARELYCPVCPNETLDICQTEACAQWREEIRSQLAAGQNEQEIVASFVRRYGDRVLGTPQDPALRTLSLATPFLIAGLGLLLGIFTFVRWRRRPRLDPAAASESPPVNDGYRDQLEQDLKD